jgi:hypothetical protein
MYCFIQLLFEGEKIVIKGVSIDNIKDLIGVIQKYSYLDIILQSSLTFCEENIS